MGPEIHSEILRNLEDSRRCLYEAATAVSEERAKVRPAPERWSVLECVEHVVTVEERFLGRLENAPRLDAPRIDTTNEAAIAEKVENRETRRQAPDAAVPTGKFATVAEALAAFDAIRARTLQAARNKSADLYHLAAEHPVFGKVNGVEVLIIIAGHARRHAAQMREAHAAVA
jgi:uncharacterized damage-inducible protein DinB